MIDDTLAKDNFSKIVGQPTDSVSLLVKAIQSCGVSISIWQSKKSKSNEQELEQSKPNQEGDVRKKTVIILTLKFQCILPKRHIA